MREQLEGKFRKKYGMRQPGEKEEIYSVRWAMLKKHLRLQDRAQQLEDPAGAEEAEDEEGDGGQWQSP